MPLREFIGKLDDVEVGSRCLIESEREVLALDRNAGWAAEAGSARREERKAKTENRVPNKPGMRMGSF